jgi:acyl-CoA reductase-like NAD-dependent aldehyde dehydrogenase
METNMCRMQKYWMAATLVVVVVAARGGAQQATSCEHPGRVMGPAPLLLLAQKSVQAELKLSDDQIKQVADALAQQRAEFKKLRDLPHEQRAQKSAELMRGSYHVCKEIVTPEQGHRLRQIVWQQQGALAFANPHVAEVLKLSDEQKEKMAAIHREAQEAARKFFAQDPPPAREDIHRTMWELRKNTEAKLMALITPEQKEKWQELTGELFTGEISRHARHTN